MHLSWKQAWNIIERAVRMRRERKIGQPSIIGKDKKSYRKGHRYITLVYGMMNSGNQFIADDRKEKSLDEYFNTLTRDQLSSITKVPMDMWDPFISGTMEYVPDAETKILFNKFHVMKHFNEAVDITRKRVNRAMPKQSSTDLKGTEHIWLYASGNFPNKYREKYEERKKSDLLTEVAYSMKGNIRELWNAPFRDDSMKYWNSWYSWVYIPQ